jgi:probable phosphoglycerate mutase
MHLYLIRHGQSYVNLSDWKPASPAEWDASLTPLGQRQATALAAWLPTAVSHVDALYASTMSRAQETAVPLSQTYNIPITPDDRLRELGNNRADHSPYPRESLPVQFVGLAESRSPFVPVMHDAADSETFTHFRTRVGLFMDAMLQRPSTDIILVVCHGGVINAVFDFVFNVGMFRSCDIWNLNTAVTHFEYDTAVGHQPWKLHFQGRTEHLNGLPDSH